MLLPRQDQIQELIELLWNPWNPRGTSSALKGRRSRRFSRKAAPGHEFIDSGIELRSGPPPEGPLIILLALLGAAIGAEWLPSEPLFARPLADPREPSSSLTVNSDARIRAALASELGLVQVGRRLRAQVGISAGTWMDFRAEEGLTFAFDSFDGRFGIPVDLAWPGGRLRVGWRHTSAHLADGQRTAQNHPPHITWSREEAYALGSGAVGPITAYLGGSWLIRTLPDLPRAGVQAGFVARVGRRYYGAVDLQLRGEDDWQPGVSGRAGVWLGPGASPPLRVGLAAYEGPDRRGQFLGLDETWVGLQVGIEGRRPAP